MYAWPCSISSTRDCSQDQSLKGFELYTAAYFSGYNIVAMSMYKDFCALREDKACVSG